MAVVVSSGDTRAVIVEKRSQVSTVTVVPQSLQVGDGDKAPGVVVDADEQRVIQAGVQGPPGLQGPQGPSGPTPDTLGFYVATAPGEVSARVIELAEDELVGTSLDGITGNPSLGLADVPDSGTGTLQLTTFDAKGRKTGAADATASDQTITGVWQYTNGIIAGSFPAGPFVGLAAGGTFGITGFGYGDGANLGVVTFPTLTVSQNWQLPNASGTIALTSDIPVPSPQLHYRRDDLTATAGDNTITLDKTPYESSLSIAIDGALAPLSAYSGAGTAITLTTPAAGGELYSVSYWASEVPAASTISTSVSLLVQVQTIFTTLSAQGGLYAPSPTTCWQDTAGTTPAGVGDPVARCDDLSGNGNHWIQATSAARPKLQAVGGYYRLEADGVDDMLSATTTMPLAEGMSIYHASDYASGSDTSLDGGVAVGTTNANFFVSGQRQSHGFVMARSRYAAGSVGVVTAQSSTAEVFVGTPAVHRAEMSVSGLLVQANNGSEYTGASSGTVGPAASARITLGRLPSQASLYPAYTYGAVVLDKILSPADRATVKAFLADLSGVTL